LLDELNQLEFYDAAYPKSLGREWVETRFLPILKQYQLSPQDTLATCCEHMAMQIARCIEESKLNGKVLVTGGGTLNTHLINRIKTVCGNSTAIVVPDKELILFKEAIIFAFLGLLRAKEERNCLSSVTGAEHDVCGGSHLSAAHLAN
jgi:anhydro-N-acetylmuramic acid kinase